LNGIEALVGVLANDINGALSVKNQSAVTVQEALYCTTVQ
jgi:hypothetical protein